MVAINDMPLPEGGTRSYPVRHVQPWSQLWSQLTHAAWSLPRVVFTNRCSRSYQLFRGFRARLHTELCCRRKLFMQVIQGPQLLLPLIGGCTLIVFLLVGWHVVLDVRSCNSVPDNASEIDGFLRAHCPRAAAYAHTVACAVLQRASEHSVRRPPRRETRRSNAFS